VLKVQVVRDWARSLTRKDGSRFKGIRYKIRWYLSVRASDCRNSVFITSLGRHCKARTNKTIGRGWEVNRRKP